MEPFSIEHICEWFSQIGFILMHDIGSNINSILDISILDTDFITLMLTYGFEIYALYCIVKWVVPT